MAVEAPTPPDALTGSGAAPPTRQAVRGAGTPYEDTPPAIVARTQDSVADRGTNKLTVQDLKAMQRG
ncbi:hypothetical protein AB0M87_14620 [Streptomyces sp. NPDC051320]|uniref:hypothetical protein n=1 Tax=Streptomyces sp. NPDC051320 TaxID=3154644 RepID=UPI003446648F